MPTEEKETSQLAVVVSMRDLKAIKKALECYECRNVQIIFRKFGRNKRKGHIKHLYCFRCRKTTVHKEL